MTRSLPFHRSLKRSSLVLLAVFALWGCSVRKIVVNEAGDALSSGSSGFAKDDDPELVRDAAPFALKTIESLIEASPDHQGLLTSAASGFMQYAYAFIQMDADFIEEQDLNRATAMRLRAKKLYLRALNYGFRGLEVDEPGFREQLQKDPDAALAKLSKKHVPLLYYTGASWALAFAVDKTDAELSADQALMEKMLKRALALDETWNLGAIHEFFISWEAGHASSGGTLQQARAHFARAMEISKGAKVAPLVTLAESVSVKEQNKKEFEQLLNDALAVDINKAAPDQKLANVLAQRRAQWLLAHVDELILE
jgi:predicted anti-sigma-YlaC factor YlaD